MYKDYFNYKVKDKRIRWVYNREGSHWKRESPNTYASHTLLTFIQTIVALTALVIGLVWLFVNLPFTHNLGNQVFDDYLLFLIWFSFFGGFALIGIFAKRFGRAWFYTALLSLMVFFSSDIRRLELDTPFYYYLGYALVFGLLFALATRVMRFLLTRKMPSRVKKDKKLPLE